MRLKTSYSCNHKHILNYVCSYLTIPLKNMTKKNVHRVHKKLKIGQ